MTIGDWIAAATFVTMILGGIMVVARKDAVLQRLVEAMDEVQRHLDDFGRKLDRIDQDLVRKDEVIRQINRSVEDHETRLRKLEQQG